MSILERFGIEFLSSVGVKIDRSAGMRPKNRSGRMRGRRYRSNAAPHSLGLSCMRDHANNLVRLQQLSNAYAHCLSWNVVQLRKPTLADLLPPASLVQSNDKIRHFCLEVSRRIVERQVPIFANATEREIDGSFCYRTSDLSCHMIRVTCPV